MIGFSCQYVRSYNLSRWEAFSTDVMLFSGSPTLECHVWIVHIHVSASPVAGSLNLLTCGEKPSCFFLLCCRICMMYNRPETQENNSLMRADCREYGSVSWVTLPPNNCTAQFHSLVILLCRYGSKMSGEQAEHGKLLLHSCFCIMIILMCL